ncbi:MAG: PIG-L family deacetylase [Cytophagales bacterium]|nr:PIG-L family deacetylase [Cytophagales bacterium]
MTIKKLQRLVLLLVLIATQQVQAQRPKTYHSGEVRQMLKKLNVLGTVLYVAAHPDDENTSMIAYFANEELYRTGYLAATRGDGGQNLIGSEIREGLGIIRTQELLAARRTDGGQQFFSRANDFGYSKNSNETLTIWEKEKVLSDFVRVFRKFRPDVIVTRFTPTRGGHGHHLTSAILAQEAFKLSGDAEAYPEHGLEPWQPSKIFWNTSFWFYRGQEFDTTEMVSVDVGKYNPNLGQSYTEISALSRSMHKSQGFGSTGRRGTSKDWLVQWEGEKSKEVFGGLDATWSRVVGAEEVAEYLQMAEDNYNPQDPSETLMALAKGKRALSRLPDQFWKEIKLKEIDQTIAAISGMYFEVVADDYAYVPGDSIQLRLEGISRIGSQFKLKEVRFSPWDKTQDFNSELKANRRFNHDLMMKIPDDMPLSQPYWLREASSLGMYTVNDVNKIGLPENPSAMNATFLVQLEDQFLEFNVPIVYKRNDPVDGETYRPIAITPPVMVNMESEVLVFGDNQSRPIAVTVTSGRVNTTGRLQLDLPKGWSSKPEFQDFDLSIKGEEQIFTFSITPPKKANVNFVSASATLSDDSKWNKGINVIAYDHIPTQTTFPESRVKLVKLDLEKAGDKLGYIAGAGDVVADNLRQIGYEVDDLVKEDITAENLRQYDAIILGVRAFNTVDWLSYKNTDLFKYVENGGTMLVQYNTNRRMVTQQVAPYDLTLSRDRVTVEEAEVRMLAPDHPVLNKPNKITSKDFDGWVQERGLYFPNEWSDEFTPILSSNDEGETPKDGGLLVAKYGKGHYVYSGYSWFRELPAGVSGAYRLFVNLISLGDDKPSN